MDTKFRPLSQPPGAAPAPQCACSFGAWSSDRRGGAVAGNAERAARRVLALFEKLLGEAIPEQITVAETWGRWVKLLDSSLLGGAQSTFIAVALMGNEVVGACVGDSRAYLINRDGECRILTDGAAKHRLGSGQAQPFPIRLTLNTGDVLLLSDGAWRGGR